MFEEAYTKAMNATIDSILVGLMDLMFRMLAQSNQADQIFMHPSRVVPHNSNRGGANMEYRKMFTKFGKILGVGFSKTKCGPSRAICFQRKPSTKMNLIERASASPYFATYDDKKVDAGSAGCGRLNQGLEAANQEVEVPREFREDGDLVQPGQTHMSKHDICKKDEAVTHCQDLRTAMDVGLKWTYIYSHVEDAYPGLPNIFQKALNVEHHIGEGETWDEQFGAVARSIVAHYKSGANNAPDTKQLCRMALASKPRGLQTLSPMSSTVRSGVVPKNKNAPSVYAAT